MKKRCLITLLVLCCVLAGCGGKKNGIEQGTSNPDTGNDTKIEDGTDVAKEPNVAQEPDTDPEIEQIQKEMEESDAEFMQQYLLEHVECSLPKEIKIGEFDVYLSYGGYPVLNENGDTIGAVGVYPSTQAFFEDGRLVQVSAIANHSYFEGFTTVDGGDVPCVVSLYSYEKYVDDESGKAKYVGEGLYWYAFWAKEGMKPVYGAYLDADAGYDQDDLMEIVKGVSFSEGAFVTDSQKEVIDEFYDALYRQRNEKK